MGKKLNLVGQVFGRLTVIAEGERNPKYPNQRNWRCRCSCGNVVYGRSARLRSGHTQSCGCLHTEHMEAFRRRNWKGFGDIPGTYWGSLTTNAERRGIPLDISIEEAWDIYKKQGGVCALSGLPIPFSNKGRTHAASLDRKDSTQGYSPSNTWWVHKDINIMKKDHPLAYFQGLCRSVAATRRGDAFDSTDT